MGIYDIIFDTPLVEGIIQKRKSQFTILVDVNGEVFSKSNDPNRKTPYTVEAISLNQPEDPNKSWIGINQNAANRYVEHYLRNDSFADMVGSLNANIQREKFLGFSKLDFLVGDTYLEVKTPLQQLQVDIPEYIKIKKVTPFSSTDRFVKHITELANSLQNHQRAILLTCFIYDNPGFEVIKRSTNYEQVRKAVNNAVSKGVETWQVNFQITPTKIRMLNYFKTTNDFLDN